MDTNNHELRRQAIQESLVISIDFVKIRVNLWLLSDS